jgi:mRNA interferase YafQ
MRRLIWTKRFTTAISRVIRKKPSLRSEVERTLNLLERDVFEPSLETHKLKGKLAGRWACTVERDVRIVFRFVQIEGEQQDVIQLLRIGTHDEVY